MTEFSMFNLVFLNLIERAFNLNSAYVRYALATLIKNVSENHIYLSHLF